MTYYFEGTEIPLKHIEWLSNKENQVLLNKVIDAQTYVGKYGTIIVTIHQGEPTEVAAHSMRKC